jgi:orotate phosphoribosyltransferase
MEVDIVTNTFDNLPVFDKERLLKLFKEYAYKRGEFPLASGRISTYYFNSKSFLLLPEGAFLAARAMVEKIRGSAVDAVGGAGIGAAPITGAMAVLCHLDPSFQGVTFFIDRKKPKEHGDKKRIEGPDIKEGSKIIVIEDVATTGSSAMSTVRELRSKGCDVIRVIALLDRKEGAAELFAAEGLAFDAVISIDELELDLT